MTIYFFMRSSIRNEKGSLPIVMAIIIVFVLFILGISLISISTSEVRQGFWHERTTQANYVSMSGAEIVATYLVNNQDDGGTVKDLLFDIQNGETYLYSDNLVNSEYDVNVSGFPGVIFIESTGKVSDEYERTNTLIISNLEPPPHYGNFAISAKTIIEAAGGAFTIEGSIMSNGPQILSESQLSNVSGDSVFNSDNPMPEVDYPFEFPDGTEFEAVEAITGNYNFLQGKHYRITANAQGDAINIGGNSELIFNTGTSGDETYMHLEGDFKQGGNAKITLNGSGKVYFFIDGSINLFGGAWNTANYAGDVYFIVPNNPPDDPNRSISLSGNTSYMAHIMAPDVNMVYNGGGNNWFTGLAWVNHFKGHGNFKIDQHPIIDADLDDFISWPWFKRHWQAN